MGLLSQIDLFKLALLLVFVAMALFYGKKNRRQRLWLEQLRRGQVENMPTNKSELATSMRVALLNLLISGRMRDTAHIAIIIQLPFALMPEYDALTMQLLAFAASSLMVIREVLYHYSELNELNRTQYSKNEDWM